MEDIIKVIRACSFWQWLSESYLIISQKVFYEKIWELASAPWPFSLGSPFKKNVQKWPEMALVFDANFHIFLHKKIWRTNKYDPESHCQELQDNLTFYILTIQECNFLLLYILSFLPNGKWPNLVIFVTFDTDRILSPNNNQTDATIDTHTLMYFEDDAINNQSYDIRHHLWKQNSALLVAASLCFVCVFFLMLIKILSIF